MILSWLDNWAQIYNCVPLSNGSWNTHWQLCYQSYDKKNVVFVVHISVLTDENES